MILVVTIHKQNPFYGLLMTHCMYYQQHKKLAIVIAMILVVMLSLAHPKSNRAKTPR